MPRKQSFITVTDQFCGAGGSSVGATKAGAELKLALNHWKLAIETHNSNFPKADHDCTDISACDPRKYPSTDILITSPECTNHSLAKGIPRKYQKQLEMFGKVTIDPAEERSRATMWDVPRFAEYHKYNIIIVENVVEARMWVMWDAWLHAMDLLDYDHQCIYFNSMFAHPTPQSRDRMYVVFWRKGNKKPNLNFTPRAWCAKCGHDVESVQSWKPGRNAGRYGKQYAYCCPTCGEIVQPYYYAAANAIDWAIPIQRIGDRERPLKETTLRRVRIGLEKFGKQAQLVANYTPGYTMPVIEPFATVTATDHHALLTPFVAPLRGRNTPKAITDPLDTLAASGQHHAVVVPYIIETQWAYAEGDRSSSVTDPLTTQTAQQGKAIVIPPFLTSYYGNPQSFGMEDAAPTMTSRDHQALVIPPYLVNMQADNPPTDLREAMPTVLTGDHHYLTVPPFILGSYTRISGQKAALSGVDDPLPTLPGRATHYVVQPGELPKVEDCGFRMLEPAECGRAMAFPDTYVVLGNKRQRVKQYGNAVTPPVMQMLIQRCIESMR